jgi:enoyl-CoA hydratase/carnithine racemase
LSSIDDGIALLQLNNKPVNVLQYQFLEHMTERISKEIEGKFKGLIVTSALKTFSAGADINEFYKRATVDEYMAKFDQFIIAVTKLSMPTIAAINGHAIAGGAVLANACDYRFIVSDAKIGLTETAVGLALPSSVYERIDQILGYRNASKVGLEGKLYNSDEALAMGWVDAVAQGQDQLMQITRDKMKQLSLISLPAYVATKQVINHDLLTRRQHTDQDTRKSFCEFVKRDHTHQLLGNYLDAISKKKNK